jgi:hypothetical protein
LLCLKGNWFKYSEDIYLSSEQKHKKECKQHLTDHNFIVEHMIQVANIYYNNIWHLHFCRLFPKGSTCITLLKRFSLLILLKNHESSKGNRARTLRLTTNSTNFTSKITHLENMSYLLIPSILRKKSIQIPKGQSKI